jgi:hypothetical protein
MEIRKDSWHYWLFDLSHDGNPPPKTNLCSYFWRTVFSVLVCIVVVALVIAVVYWACWVLYFHTLASLGVLALVAALVGAFVFHEEVYLHRERSEPGLVGSYFQAKKSKMCPIITFAEKG